eukprot:TRINITY_DN51017_c0_g1_i1.p1 TRINITY_DN51017_c0_g1~~TRINITY_DN51017_c0_g1_i1.p1  ORF type:complete len:383 (-),score=76.63 TRINITY_DN51017_c0_g1_i1:710-1858(-)
MTEVNQELTPAQGHRYAADFVRRKIRKGEYHPGDNLPSMETLATELGLHRNTVDIGMKLLKKEKVVYSRFGGGTMVCDNLPASLKALALLLPDTESEHWQRVSKEIALILKCSGWELDVHSHCGSSWTFRKLVRKLASGRYAGALIAASHDLVNGSAPLAALAKDGFPMTFIGHGLDETDCWIVDDGDFAGGYHGTKHLLECRFKRIGLIGCKLYNGEDFVQGCRQALYERNGDPVASCYADDEKHALRFLKSWLESDDLRLDAVFFHRVEHAQPAFGYLQSKRIQIGGSMGFITFDDTLFHRLTIPSPTAIRRYPKKLGKRIAQIFLEQLGLPVEQRNFARNIEAQVGLDIGRSTGDRRTRKVFYAENPYGGRREPGRFPY